MAFNIDAFASNISRYGILHANKFEVEINNKQLPSGENNMFEYMKVYNNLDAGTRSSFDKGLLIHKDRIESVRLPGLTVDTFQTRRYGVGPDISSATNVRFDPLSISIISDKDLNLYNFFYVWLSTVFDFGGNLNGRNTPSYMTEYKELYSTSLIVKVFETTGKLKGKYEFFEAFPIGVSDPSLSWSNSNSLYKFDVNFIYTNWTLDSKSAQT